MALAFLCRTERVKGNMNLIYWRCSNQINQTINSRVLLCLSWCVHKKMAKVQLEQTLWAETVTAAVRLWGGNLKDWCHLVQRASGGDGRNAADIGFKVELGHDVIVPGPSLKRKGVSRLAYSMYLHSGAYFRLKLSSDTPDESPLTVSPLTHLCFSFFFLLNEYT